MLHPNVPANRRLYTSALTPPNGMELDMAIGTTFSMDLLTLLEVPIFASSLVLDKENELSQVYTLNALRRFSKKITVFVQRGRIQVPKISKSNPLFGLLEDMAIEVLVPNDGVFHPKVWAMRFTDSNQMAEKYRLVVLTRNLTKDRSWDLSLQLEGEPCKRINRKNQPIKDFFSLLPNLVERNTNRKKLRKIKERLDQTKEFAEKLRRVEWELPSNFSDLNFILPQHKKHGWKRTKSKRLAIISPFCSDGALKSLVKQTDCATTLISREDTLISLKKGTLDLFDRCQNLQNSAIVEDNEETTALQNFDSIGLHAKAYILETSGKPENTHLVIGSANATNAALVAYKNIEFLVELIGKKNKELSIDGIFGENGLKDFLINFDKSMVNESLVNQKKVDKYLETMRSEVITANLSLVCSAGSSKNLKVLTLKGKLPKLENIASLRMWPVSVNKRNSVKISRDQIKSISLGEFKVSHLTEWIACELVTIQPKGKISFVLNIPIENLPEDRDSSISNYVINNKIRFNQYLRLTLDDIGVFGVENNIGSGYSGRFGQLSNKIENVILEDLVRTFCRHPEKVEDISTLISDLSKTQNAKLIPKGFLELWRVFEAANGGKNVKK